MRFDSYVVFLLKIKHETSFSSEGRQFLSFALSCEFFRSRLEQPGLLLPFVLLMYVLAAAERQRKVHHPAFGITSKQEHAPLVCKFCRVDSGMPLHTAKCNIEPLADAMS